MKETNIATKKNRIGNFDLRPAYTGGGGGGGGGGRLPADLSHATQMNMDKCSANHQ